MKRFGVLIFPFIIGCGYNGDQKISVSNSTHNINVVFQFIQQIKDLCTAQTNPGDYETQFAYNKAIADCTFANLQMVNLQALNNFQADNCSANSDLSQFTPEQISNIQAACGVLK